MKAEIDMYHISDLKKFLRCELLYFYSKDDKKSFKPYLRTDENIIDLLKRYFDIQDCFLGVRNDSNEAFFEAYDKQEWFIHPRFADGELRINIPLLHKRDDVNDLYFLYYGTHIKELDLLTYRVSVKMLQKLGVSIGELYLIYFNEEYISNGEIEADKLFVCTDTYKNRKILEIVNEHPFDYEEVIEKMQNYDYEQRPLKKNRFCKQNGICDYYDNCFVEEDMNEADSILTLVSSQYKNEMYDEGIRYLKDIDVNRLEGNKVQYSQVQASRNGGQFVDKLALRHWLEKLDQRPISFIDFEWDRYLVPPYVNMRPLDVLCFEFALYCIDKENHMQHHTFVGTDDCRREFIEELLEYLPQEGPVLGYNAYGAECLRLKELGEMFPEYKEKLDAINERFIDLAEPFTEGLVYDIRMEGNYSLKKLVAICSDYSYDDLDIDDGMEAVFKWRDMVLEDKDEKETILKDLEEYCSLDAYGLFLVYKWLIKLALESKQ